MVLPAHAICAPDGSNGLAMHVGHTMNVHFKIPTRAVCGAEKKTDEACVPLVVSSRLNYGLGYFRILSRDDDGHRLDLERVESEHGWVRDAKFVICVSPELYGLVRHKQHEIIKRFCTHEMTRIPQSPEDGHLYGRPLWQMAD